MKKPMRWMTVGLVLSFALSAGAAGERKLVWSDEFNGTELDTKRWNRCGRGMSDWNRHMSTRSDLVELKDGALVLWGVANLNTNDDPRPYLTGGVQSQHKGLMGIGKVEIRVKFEDHQKGAWPALWMLGDQPDAQGRKWPWAGEIDIVERLNGDPYVYHTVHSGWTHVKKHKKDPPHGGVKAAIRNGDWNVYGLEVTEKELIWSVNGAETFRRSISCSTCSSAASGSAKWRSPPSRSRCTSTGSASTSRRSQSGELPTWESRSFKVTLRP